MEPDPRLEAACAAFSRLTDISQQCHDEGKARWTAALDRQATMLDACAKPSETESDGETTTDPDASPSGAAPTDDPPPAQDA